MSMRPIDNSENIAALAAKPLAEREQDLWLASEKYMRGDITLERLEEI